MDFAELTGVSLNQPQNQVPVHPDVMVQEDRMVSLANLVISAVGEFLVLLVPMAVKENAVCLDPRVMICHRKYSNQGSADGSHSSILELKSVTVLFLEKKVALDHLVNQVKMDQSDTLDQKENLAHLVEKAFQDHADQADDVDHPEARVKWVLLVTLVHLVIQVTLDQLELVLRHKNITRSTKQS